MKLTIIILAVLVLAGCEAVITAFPPALTIHMDAGFWVTQKTWLLQHPAQPATQPTTQGGK